jgi:hypothetical protein
MGRPIVKALGPAWSLPATSASYRRDSPQRVGFDRSTVRQRWLVPSAELTFVIGRLL